jgi:hypothetical protein
MSGLEKALFNLKVRPYLSLGQRGDSLPFLSVLQRCEHISADLNKADKYGNSSRRNNSTAKQRKLAKTRRRKKISSRRYRLHSPSPPEPVELTGNTQAIQQGHQDIAKIYAQNAIRKQNERLNLLRLGSRIDAVASRVQTAVTMRQVTGSMMNVVKGMDQAMKAMDLEKVSPRLWAQKTCRPSFARSTDADNWTDLSRNGPLRNPI